MFQNVLVKFLKDALKGLAASILLAILGGIQTYNPATTPGVDPVVAPILSQFWALVLIPLVVGGISALLRIIKWDPALAEENKLLADMKAKQRLLALGKLPPGV